MRWTIVIFALLFPISAGAQFNGCPAGFCSPKSIATVYQGPGDVAGVATVNGGSCARVNSASLASTSISLCDLVDSAAPTVVICTLRATLSGWVDLTGTYCTGGVTPAVKCAAATGASCNISKVYDQVGASAGWASSTAAAQPKLTFSAINGLPGIACASGCVFPSGNITLPQPFTFAYVSVRTGAVTTLQNVLSISGGLVISGYAASASTANMNAGTQITLAATDNLFHSIASVFNGLSSALLVDGASSAITTGGSNALSATPLRLGSANGAAAGLTGTIMEFWVYGSGSVNTTAINNNQHSTNGYCAINGCTF